MQQLLKISSVPIALELKVNNAKLEYHSNKAHLEQKTEKKGLNISSKNIKVKLDTFEARNSVSPSTRRSIEQGAELGKQAAYEATARYAQEGHLLVTAQLNDDVMSQIISQRIAQPTGDFQLGFSPSTGPEITWDDPNLSIQYEMDSLVFQFKLEMGSINFIPGEVAISVTQYPDVVIEYIGEPNYVPPSSNPNYVPIDTLV